MSAVSVEYEQDTVDTGDPCYHVRKNDSWMALVHGREKDRLVISHVTSKQKGDFSDMMDKATEELGTNQIMFTMVINDNLKQTLNGFEEDTMYWDKLEEEMTVLKGEWNND